MRAIPLNFGTIHFIGIGGIGMSGLAEILHALGYTVQGSDAAENQNVIRLREKGVVAFTGHDAAHVKDVAAVVISTAIKPDNPELVAAREANIPVVRRADVLAELMRLKWGVAISGTHGKTTTTCMIGGMLETGGFDPTVINGGIVNAYGTNVRLGNGAWVVAEADESDGSFTRLPAAVAVITNMDPEHLDHYGSFENIRLAFRRFVENVPFYGYAVLCCDHPALQALIPELTDRRLITYGFSPQADIRAVNIRQESFGSTFDVQFGDAPPVTDFYLPMPGRHNVQNALAALAIAREMEIPYTTMKQALRHFSGVKRRFTKTGEVNGITIIDDYGHHPVEIEAVLKTARTVADHRKGRVIAVVQPHRYSRLQSLFQDFCTCFHDSDSVIVADVYPAGEAPIEGVDKTALAEGIKACGHRDVHTLEDRRSLPGLVVSIARPGDLVVCLGAGDITKWANALPEEMSSPEQTTAKAS